MNDESIDEVLGGDYVLVNSIEGDNAEIDAAAVDGDVGSAPLLDDTQESIDLTMDDSSDDEDASCGCSLGAANEVINLTLEDTDDETEQFTGHYTNKLRPNYRRLKKRKVKTGTCEKLCSAKEAPTSSPALALRKKVESDAKSSTSDSSSVMSRFSENYSDEQKEPQGSSSQPAKNSVKKTKGKTTIKTPRGKGKKNAPVKASSKKLPTKGKGTHAKICNDLGVVDFHQQLNFPIVREEVKDCYYLMKFFGDKMLVDKKQYSPKQEKSPVDRVTVVNGMKYELVYSKFVQRKGKSYNVEDSMSPKYYKSFYIGISDGHGSKLNLAEQLLRIADFESLAYDEGPEKVIARLSLLVSPACNSPDSRRDPLVRRLNLDKFKLIEDDGHEGCGFIPRCLLTAILGNSKRAEESTAIQVRVFSPTGFGIGKGMLMVKDEIDKIEIPLSMIKVKKSTSKDPLHDDVVLIVSGVFPSVPARVIGKIVDPYDNPTVSQIKDIEPPSEMFQNVMLAKGVAKESLDWYISNFKEDKTNGTKHASLVGVADPTDSIPPDHVFLTGMSDPPKRVFLTRSPCTEASDGMVVKVCSKGDFLSDDFKFLSNLPFGTVIFPLGNPSLPSTINSSDLDGDKFFALWDERLVKEADRSDDKFAAGAFAIHYDELVGITFRHEGYDAEIVAKEYFGEDYLVTVDTPSPTTITLSRSEIMSGRRFMNRVLGHSVRKEKTVFHVEWEDKSNEKHLSSDLKREFATPPEVLLEYVQENKLAKRMKDCKWFENHLGQANLIKIIGHRGVGKDIEVRCEYDDNDISWEPLNDHLIESKLLVGKYVNEHCLWNRDGWQRAVTLWLREIQDCLIVQRDYEVGLLVTRTCSLWKKACTGFGVHSAEALIWGRAYKDANELKKHAGSVKLPLIFYNKITGKQEKNCKFLLLLEKIFGYVGPPLSSDHPDNDENERLRMRSTRDDSGWTRTHSAISDHQAGKWFTNDDSSSWGRSPPVSTTKRDEDQGWGRKTTGKYAPTAVTFNNTSQACVSHGRQPVPLGARNSDDLSTSDAAISSGWGWGRSSDASNMMKNDCIVSGRKTDNTDSLTVVSVNNSSKAHSSGSDNSVPSTVCNTNELPTSTSGNDSGRGSGKSSDISTMIEMTASKGSSTLVSVHNYCEADSSGWGRSVPSSARNSNDLSTCTAGSDDSASGWDKSLGVHVANQDDGWGRKIANKDSPTVVSINNCSESDSSGWGSSEPGTANKSNVVAYSTAGIDSGSGWGRSFDVSTTIQDDVLGWGRKIPSHDSSCVNSTHNRRAADFYAGGRSVPSAERDSNDVSTSTASKDTDSGCDESSDMPSPNQDGNHICGGETANKDSSALFSVMNQMETSPTAASNSNDCPLPTEGGDCVPGLGRSPNVPTANKDESQGRGRMTSCTDSSSLTSVSKHSGGDSFDCGQSASTAANNSNELSTYTSGIGAGSCCDKSSDVTSLAREGGEDCDIKNANKDSPAVVFIKNCSEAGISGSDRDVSTVADNSNEMSNSNTDEDSRCRGKPSCVLAVEEGNGQVWGTKAAHEGSPDAECSGLEVSAPQGESNSIELNSLTVAKDSGPFWERSPVAPAVDSNDGDNDLNVPSTSNTSNDVRWSSSTLADPCDDSAVGPLS